MCFGLALCVLKPGGKMVYATCSVLPSENQEQIAKFITSEEGSQFKLIKEKKIFAHKTGYDGFYMALLEKPIQWNITTYFGGKNNQIKYLVKNLEYNKNIDAGIYFFKSCFVCKE